MNFAGFEIDTGVMAVIVVVAAVVMAISAAIVLARGAEEKDLTNRLRGAARRNDLFRRLSAELVGVHRQLLVDVASPEDLDPMVAAANKAALAQQIRCNHRTGIKALSEGVEIDYRKLGPERVVEPALRHAAVQRHLPAFEASLELEARARLRALVTAAGLGARTRPVSASDTFL